MTAMLKLKQESFSILNNGTLRFFSTSTVASITDTLLTLLQPDDVHQQTSLISNTERLRTSDTPFLVSLDPVLYVSVLHKVISIYQIKEVHGQVAVSGVVGNLEVANKLLYQYAQCKLLTDACALFREMKDRDAFTWSLIVGGFSKIGDYTNCFRTFRELIRCGTPRPDNFTIPFVIRVCRDWKDSVMARSVHDVVLKLGLDSDHYVSAALVDMYAKCRVIADARQVFDKMPRKDLVTWTVMIGGCAECGNPNESLALFDAMRDSGIVPDMIAMVTVVYACAKLGAMHKADVVSDYISRLNFSLNVILGTAMIDMYSKCGNVDSARKIFDMMKKKNVISWSAMIAAYGYHGQGKKALDLFTMMLRSGIAPNKITFVSLLYACSHAGLVEDGQKLFSSMWDDYGVRPDVKHYTCMVDLLGRAGKLNEAFDLADSMTVEKDEGLWSALLGACRIHKNMNLAEKAAKSLLELQPQNPGHYVLVSNLYANAGNWQNVAKTRDLMNLRRLKKIPGWTWIEVDNKIYQFSVGESSHPRSKEIYGKLSDLKAKLELAGYVPDTSFVLHDVDEEVKIGMLNSHSEKLAIAFGLTATPEGTPIRITKNLRVCGDCHTFCKFVSDITDRLIVVRDSNRFHHFKDGVCSCGDYW